ncbi:MAG: thiamine phosphate synthase [Acidobacteria bacterium]|nr:thiamine phosphate synthase [Acidobacteriota bacterium]MBA3885367.1 thiamine phosphate synthase [Acidobacteriota bacterium]
MPIALPPLYAIIDTAVCRQRGVTPVLLAAACLRGGARLLQLRCKEGSSATVLALASKIQALAWTHGGRLVINDRADIAMMTGAGGVHVGQDDLPVADVRRLVGPEALVGRSTHTREQVDQAAQEAVTYIAVGPVFGTATKDTGYTARGLDLVRHGAATGLPVVGIGGITLDNAAAVLAAGASSVAVISDLLTGADPERRVRMFLARLPPFLRHPRSGRRVVD